ncbi:hypothetical protein NDU88_004491 [Pleurodeles waltl]|uniref:Uncharacterized protein n=1 Tax=Pleurodeles waltl TaxID=8319 RepID=A0AAV7PHM8_PLEWA|nr:hypothetical protein NDU88_004491 [Pleurodeles waltl]
MWSPSLRSPQLSRGAGMDACECSGGARAGSLRPERHNRNPRAQCGAAGKCSSQRSRGPEVVSQFRCFSFTTDRTPMFTDSRGDLSRGHSHVFEVTGTSDQVDHILAVTVG